MSEPITPRWKVVTSRLAVVCLLTPVSVAEILKPVSFTKEAESSHVTGLGFDLITTGDKIQGTRKTGDHRGFNPIIIEEVKNSDPGPIHFDSNKS